MPDYFRHLVERSLQPQAVVQPRLAGRYEPLQPGGPAWNAGMEAGVETEAQAPVDARSQGRREQAAPAPLDAPAPASRLSPPPEKTPGVLPAPPASLAVASQPAAGPRSAPALPPEPPPPSQPAPAPLASMITVEAAREGPPLAVQPAARRPEAPGPEAASPLGDHAPRPESPPAPPRLELKPVLAPPPPPGQPERLPQPPQPPASEPAPVVNITIGRIEVRAAQPANPEAAVRKTRSTPPVMSLEEYLKRRNGGRG